MKIYGELIRAQSELLGADPSGGANLVSGRFWFNTTDSDLKYYNGSVRVAANLDEAQTFTNKILTGNQMASISPDGVETITFPVATDTLVSLAAAQTLTNKQINGGVIDYIEGIQQTTPSNPASGRNRLYFKNDNVLYTLDSEGNESPVGSGGGGNDTFYLERFQINDHADITDSGNGAGLTGGVLAGALASKTSGNIKGNRSITFTQAAGSLNDFFFMPDNYSVEVKEQDNDHGIVIYTKYDGNDDDIDCVVYDITNSAELTRFPIKASTRALRHSDSFYIPSTCNSIKVGFQVTTANDTQVLEIDEIELSSNPFVYKNLVESDSVRLHTGNGHGSTNNKIRRFSNLAFNVDGSYSFGAISATQTSPKGLFKITDSATDGTEIEILKDGVYSITYTDRSAASGMRIGLSLNSTQLTSDIGTINAADRLVTTVVDATNNPTECSCNIDIKLKAGDIVRPHTNANSPANTANVNLSITANVESEHVITPIKNAVNSYSARLQNTGAASVNVLSENASFIASATRTSQGIVDIVYNTDQFNETPAVTITVTEEMAPSSNDGKFWVTNSTATGCTVKARNQGAYGDFDFDIKVERQGSDVKQAELQAAIPTRGQVVGTYYDERSDIISISSIPNDNTIPQITEGTQIFNTTYYPKKIGNYLIVETEAPMRENTNTANASTIALFKDGAADAIASMYSGDYNNNTNFLNHGVPKIRKKIEITSLAPITLEVRVGAGSGANGFLNEMAMGTTVSSLGGTLHSTFEIKEIGG